MTDLETLEKCTDRLAEILIELKNVVSVMAETWHRMRPFEEEDKTNDRP